MRVLPFVCGFLCAAAVMRAEDAKPTTPPPSTPTDAQKDWHHLSGKDLETRVRDLLYDSNFDELDAIATECNDKQSRYAGGTWKLQTFFNAVSRPRQSRDPEDWKVLFERLQEWEDRSHSVFSIGAIGRTQLNYAWHVRTGSWASNVTEEQWKIFGDGVNRSFATYGRVLKKPEKCVDNYAQLLRIGLAQGWPVEKMEATLREGISVAPDYYESFGVFGFYTLERWYGRPGDSRRFLDSILKMVPGDKGYDIYTRTAVSLFPYYKTDFFGNSGCADWTTMKKGFEWITRTYPLDKVMKNSFGAYAVVAEDRATARTLLDDLTAKGEINYDAWLPAGGFETAKKWILAAP